jgi:hypothetical protein
VISVNGIAVSAAAFGVARTPPLHGRPLLPSDEVAGAPPVVVLGEAFWRGRFHGDPAIIGSVVHLDEMPATVVGVMPRHFAFPSPADFHEPLAVPAHAADATAAARTAGEAPRVIAFGRLTAGATLEQTRASRADGPRGSFRTATPGSTECRAGCERSR